MVSKNNMGTSSPSLKIIFTPSEEAFNTVSANALCSLTKGLITSGKRTPNITLARGNTQSGIYEELRGSSDMLDVLSQARFFQLDEVYPAPKSFAEFTEEEILSSIFKDNIPDEKWVRFDTSKNPEQAIKEMRNAIQVYGGKLDLALLGLGADGDDHYAQVGQYISAHSDIINPELSNGMISSYISYIETITSEDAFNVPTHGLSLAHAIMPDNLIITAKGINKAEPVYNMLCTPHFPNNAPEVSTTYLRKKKNVTVILDQDAASMIKQHTASLPKHAEMFEYAS